MVTGIAAIVIGVVLLAIAPRWADNMVKSFRKLGSEVDPAYFRIAGGVVGIASIVFGIVEITAALR
ncbi:MAG TPA: hypothetical protein VHE60_08975 [Pyrinomonadaceae bacterium]|nr:hypothetical protein [Pyrinomonadaceae bacterium]